jgi:tetratricopeptide (TPR) repeat protein
MKFEKIKMKIAGQSRFFLPLVIAFSAGTISASCDFEDAAWQTLKKSKQAHLLKSAVPAGLDAQCFAMYLRCVSLTDETISEHDFLSRIEAYTETHDRISTAMFFTIDSALNLDSRPELAADLVTLWTKTHGKPRDRLVELEKRAAYMEMDSLYSMLSRAGNLDAYELVKWGRLLGILKKYDDAARIYCEAGAREPSLTQMLRAQLLRMLSEADAPQRAEILNSYYTCSIQESGTDIPGLLRWITTVYGNFGLYSDEVAGISTAFSDPVRSARELFELAKRRFSRRLFKETIEPAIAAHAILRTEQEQNECAALLYLSYLETGKTDSAIIWFKKGKLTDPESMKRAAVLYQAAGLFVQADSLIGMMAPSITRDTLSLRQLIFTGRISDARHMATERTKLKHWRGSAGDASLWKIRTAVYTGDLAGTIDCIDSARFDMAWQGAREVLGQRYAAHIFKTDPDTYNLWGKLMRALYTGHPETMPDTVVAAQARGAVRELIYAALAEALAAERRYDLVYSLISTMPATEASPRLLYFYSESCIMQGKTVQAQQMLEKLILEYPLDVFSGKARIYLLVLAGKTGM